MCEKKWKIQIQGMRKTNKRAQRYTAWGRFTENTRKIFKKG